MLSQRYGIIKTLGKICKNERKEETILYTNIRTLRKEKGLTQQQLADHLTIDRSTYAYYESGRTRLNIDIVVKLAYFYQVSYATIIGQPEPVLSDSTGTAVPSD